MKLFRPRRGAGHQAPPSADGLLPDPALPPQRRGTWEEAALVNTDITEVVKQQVGAVTPPWKK